MPSKRFEDVGVWQRAHRWVLAVYRHTATWPSSETYGLRAQLRRSAVSIPANFAEGFKRRGPADKARFYNIAQGSIEESRYYLGLSKDLGYGDTAILVRDLDEVARLLASYARAAAHSRPASC